MKNKMVSCNTFDWTAGLVAAHLSCYFLIGYIDWEAPSYLHVHLWTSFILFILCCITLSSDSLILCLINVCGRTTGQPISLWPVQVTILCFTFLSISMIQTIWRHINSCFASSAVKLPAVAWKLFPEVEGFVTVDWSFKLVAEGFATCNLLAT